MPCRKIKKDLFLFLKRDLFKRELQELLLERCYDGLCVDSMHNVPCRNKEKKSLNVLVMVSAWTRCTMRQVEILKSEHFVTFCSNTLSIH